MKLGNNGWGTRELIIYSCILLSFLLFAMVMLNSFYDDLGKSTNSVVDTVKDNKDVSYFGYEEKMEKAVLLYVSENDVDVSNGFVVDLDTLVKRGYLEQFYDLHDGSKCSGYVIIKNINNGLDVDPNLICSNYKTGNVE